MFRGDFISNKRIVKTILQGILEGRRPGDGQGKGEWTTWVVPRDKGL